MSIQHPKPRRSYPRPQPPDMRPDGYASLTTLRASRARQVNTNPNTQEDFDSEPAIPTRRRFSVGKPVLALLLGALFLLGMVLFWQHAVLPTWNGLTDQWNYGSARVTQMDADVGHGGVSHFLAEYYQGNILIIEISVSHSNNAHFYTLSGFIENGANTPVIQLALDDTNHDGKPDLVITIEGTNFSTVLHNTGTAFQQS
jgi:hypothetical protein